MISKHVRLREIHSERMESVSLGTTAIRHVKGSLEPPTYEIQNYLRVSWNKPVTTFDYGVQRLLDVVEPIALQNALSAAFNEFAYLVIFSVMIMTSTSGQGHWCTPRSSNGESDHAGASESDMGGGW